MADITKTEVLHLAKLAMLRLTSAEVDKMVVELKAIFKMIEQMQVIDTEGVLPTAQVTGLKHVVREDKIVDYGVKTADLLAGAKQTAGTEIKVPRVK